MINHTFHPRFGFISLFLLLFMSSILASETLGMNIGVRCQAEPDTVYQAVKESVQTMSQWRSVRYVDDQRAVKAMVKNLRNYPVPVVIQVQTTQLEDSKEVVEVHIQWEQTMDPVNYPDMFFFMDTFWEKQKALGLNCVDGGTDVGL